MKKFLHPAAWTLFALLIYFPVFLHLDYLGIHHWDESRNAINALEMADNGNYLVRHYGGQPDHWETKPPLLIWLQVLFLSVLGPSELTFRLPTALAVLGTIALILCFFIRRLGDTWGGVFSVLALLTSEGYVRQHVARTGDHDALLIFFLTCFLVFFFSYAEQNANQKRHYLFLATGALIAAVLTKSISGLFFLPGAFLYLLLRRKLLPTLRDPLVYAALGSFIFLVGGYYLLRESQDPGYLYWVSHGELFPRYLNNSTELTFTNPPSRWYYFNLIAREHFRYFFFFLPLALVLVLRLGEEKRWHFFAMLFITAFLFLLAISFGTVNSWYNAPAMPLMAMMAGLGLSELLRVLQQRFAELRPGTQVLIPALLVVAVFTYPYIQVIENQVYLPNFSTPDMKYGNFLHKLRRERPELKKLFLYYECANGHVFYYQKVFPVKYGYEFDGCSPCTNFSECQHHAQPGDYVMICKPEFIWEFQAQFEATEEMDYKGCKLFKVGKPK